MATHALCCTQQSHLLKWTPYQRTKCEECSFMSWGLRVCTKKVATPLTLSYRPLLSASDDSLKIIYNNAHSLKQHFLDVKCNYNILAADIIWISETRLKSVDITEHYTMRDFKRYRIDQPKTLTPYHGLILYIHNSIEVHHIRNTQGINLKPVMSSLGRRTSSSTL